MICKSFTLVAAYEQRVGFGSIGHLRSSVFAPAYTVRWEVMFSVCLFKGYPILARGSAPPPPTNMKAIPETVRLLWSRRRILLFIFLLKPSTPLKLKGFRHGKMELFVKKMSALSVLIWRGHLGPHCWGASLHIFLFPQTQIRYQSCTSLIPMDHKKSITYLTRKKNKDYSYTLQSTYSVVV